MKRVYQTLVDPNTIGNCLQASFASVLDMSLDEVPHFVMISEFLGIEVYEIVKKFLNYNGYDVDFFTSESEPEPLVIKKNSSIDDYYVAMVPSLNKEKTFHAVVIDHTGKVIHDPMPLNKKIYYGKNIILSRNLIYYFVIKKQHEETL